MTTTVSAGHPPATEDRHQVNLVDGDVHPVFGSAWNVELGEYFPREWRIIFQNGDRYTGADAANRSSLQYSLPFNAFYPRRGYPLREDLVDEHGRPPGIDPERSARELLDDWGVDRAILIPQSLLALGALPNADAAGVIAEAGNRWLVDRWLDQDTRWRGTLVIAPQDVPRAVAEIKRWRGDRRFVSVLFSLGQTLMGDRRYWPIYEAAAEEGLAISTHPSGGEGIYSTGPSWAGGAPTHYLDYRFDLSLIYQANLANLVVSGVFERYPTIRFVFVEVGFAWLPELMWRMDATWRALREDTPWVKRPPSEYIRDHCRFTTQPMIEPPRRTHIESVLDMCHADRTLLFSTDYPHWDTDEPQQVLKDVGEPLRDRVASENALDTFGDRIL